MMLATAEDVRDARRANITRSMELAGRITDRIGPRCAYAVVAGQDQWYALAAFEQAARLFKSQYPAELAGLCAANNEDNVSSEYERILYLLITHQPFGTELEAALRKPCEMGFYVATQVAETAYYERNMRALDLAIDRMDAGFTGQSYMHKDFEHALGCGFRDRLLCEPVNLSEMLVIISSMRDDTARFRAHMDLDRHFDLRQDARKPGMFK